MTIEKQILSTVLASSLFLFPQVTFAADNGLITKPSNYSVQEPVDRFEAAVKARGQTVFGEVDHAAAAAKVGLQLQPRLVVMFGRPQVGTAALRQAPTLGIDAPQKVLVWQDDAGKVWLTYNSAEYFRSYLYPRHGLSLSIEAAKNLEKFLDEVSDQATK